MKNGGNAIISSFEHNSVLRPLEYLKENKVCNYKVAKASFDNPNVVLYEFEKLIDAETKMIVCTHASNVTGQIAPIDKTAELCNRRKIIFCLVQFFYEMQRSHYFCIQVCRELYKITDDPFL